MLKIVSLCKQVVLVSASVLVTLAFTPIVALADSSQCTPPSGPGVTRPVGADGGTYTYDCATGLWLNAHYSYNPLTQQVLPLDPVVYTYNSTTGNYDTTIWVYNAPSGSYKAVTQSVGVPPAGANVVGGPPDQSSSISNTGPGSDNNINNDGGIGSGDISNTGPNSNNSLGGSLNNNTTDSNTNNLTVGNAIDQFGSSGNALVVGNTTAGDATSGNIQDMANILNMLQSSSNSLGSNTVTFVANLNGDVNGDLMIDPTALGSVQPASATPGVGDNHLTVNNQTNASINNDINLGANSGNAGVSDNTSGGNATSGSAQAIANVVNVINSAISSGNSFIGVININGNFNGNILVPPDLINQLVASNVPTVTISNTGPDSNNNISNNTGSNNTTVHNTNDLGINNNINANSTSGQATVDHNTSAGSATSGSASNSVTAFNLTGSNVIGSNDLLVFVNVLGKWVGMIVNAPAGATAAELGSGITQNSPSNNTTNLNNNTNEQINNNITTNARSGDASVTSNTKGGNATSGNASTAVNLLNVEGSNLAFSGWFGILFINVFGTWNGNFGFSPDAANTTTGGSSSSDASTPASFAAFRFAPSTGGSKPSVAGFGSISNTGPGSVNAALAAHFSSNKTTKPKLAPAAHSNLALPIIGTVLFIFYVVGDRLYSLRTSRI